jgi:hypothetical protein
VRLLFALAALSLCACATRPGPTAPADGAAEEKALQAVITSSATFSLSKVPGQGEISRFYKALDSAHDKTVARFGGAENLSEGFTYSVSPSGAVNPFSEVEVQCLTGGQSVSGQGRDLCRVFFEFIAKEYEAKKP